VAYQLEQFERQTDVDVHRRYGRMLRAAIRRQGVKQRDIARRAQIASGDLSRALSGLRPWTQEWLDSVARLLGVSLTDVQLTVRQLSMEVVAPVASIGTASTRVTRAEDLLDGVTQVLRAALAAHRGLGVLELRLLLAALAGTPAEARRTLGPLLEHLAEQAGIERADAGRKANG
jgi:transcriptional regulator with XRE-family HTH domain